MVFLKMSGKLGPNVRRTWTHVAKTAPRLNGGSRHGGTLTKDLTALLAHFQVLAQFCP